MAVTVSVLGWNSLFAIAAEEMAAVDLDINIDYSNDPFYAELWFWIPVAFFFLLLLVLLIRGGKKSKRERKLSIKESDSKNSKELKVPETAITPKAPKAPENPVKPTVSVEEKPGHTG